MSGPRPTRVVPTLTEFVRSVAGTLSPTTEITYRSYWKLAEARFGDRPIDCVGYDDCTVVVADAVTGARQSGASGRNSEWHCVGPLRALFNRAERAGLIARNPAAALDKPARIDGQRRALDGAELGEVFDAVRTTSRDPGLDLLLVRFHLESGARREGVLTLRLRDLDDRRSTAWLREKFRKERERGPGRRR